MNVDIVISPEIKVTQSSLVPAQKKQNVINISIPFNHIGPEFLG